MTLPDQAAQYAAERGATPAQCLALQRAFMAGAQDALTSKQPRETLLAECQKPAKRRVRHVRTPQPERVFHLACAGLRS